MKACDYCGRENEDTAKHCRECGTDFPERTEPTTIAEDDCEPPKSDFINLDQMEDAFRFEEGFHRPNWNRISQVVEEAQNSGDQESVWREAIVQWVSKVRNDLGGDYRVYCSGHTVILGAVESALARRLLNATENAGIAIRGCLGDAAWGSFRGTSVVLMFAEEDDYYQYVSGFSADGIQPKSIGVYLHSGYPHVALLYDSELQSSQTIIHELSHHCLAHLPIPLWLNEGVAMTLQKIVGESGVPPSCQGEASAYWGLVSGWQPPVVWDELAERNHAFWDEPRIQAFWAGTSFQEAGESVELSYNLAEILVHLLAKNRVDFLAFLQLAHYDDAGQTAALDCLGTCLGEAVGTFLGPGNWRPLRKTIRQLWEAGQAKPEDPDHSRESSG